MRLANGFSRFRELAVELAVELEP